MNDEKDVSRPHINRSTFQSRSEHLAALLTELESKLSQSSESGSILNTSEFGQKLFSKASSEYLEKKNLDDLAKIAHQSHKSIQDFIESHEPFSIDLEHTDHCVRFYIAIYDRPFVINSLSECVRDFGVTIHTLLHPVLVVNERRISFSFLETSPLSLEEAKVLKRRLQVVLTHVLKATEDYTGMLVRAETLARVIAGPNQSSPFPQTERNELSRFLRWLTDGGFIFLGHAEWKLHEGELSVDGEFKSGLGILNVPKFSGSHLHDELLRDAHSTLHGTSLLSYRKLRTTSLVHRAARVHHICVLEYGSGGQLANLHSFVGLLTSKALAQESSSVPLIRQKLQTLFKVEGVIENSHDYKNIVDTVDSMPKEEALQMSIEDLQSIVQTVLGIQNRNETRVSFRFEELQRSVTAFIVMPRDRFNADVRERLQEHIEQAFGAAPGSSDYYLDLSNKPHARFYFNIPLPSKRSQQVNIPRLTAEIAELTRTWLDNLQDRINNSQIFSDPTTIWYRYADALPEDYRALHSVEEVERDIQILESLSPTSPVDLELKNGEKPSFYTITVYNLGSEITISKALPILENAGLEVINERATCIAPRGSEPSYIHRFSVRSRDIPHISKESFRKFLRPGLQEVFRGSAENDILNALFLSANLDVEAIDLLRAYCALLWQVKKIASRSVMFQALVEHPSAASQLWNIFQIRFHPELGGSIQSRTERINTAFITYREGLRKIDNISQDLVLRALADLLQHTVRTNFYNNSYKNPLALALKIQSEHVDIIPQPRPMFETYVRSQKVEGSHFRCGRIARGGLRWSERPQDFRSEIHGLVKTQQIKNVLIVPAGAKGGFIVRQIPSDPKHVRHAVESAYKDFIRALLSITDNRDGDTITHPENTIVYDGQDPYLVVAADKGTATFSDIANKIAVDEFNFWLGDAFASGGSDGYDHKLYGITAKGAWESVKRHFKDLGINYLEEPFRAIGIGDMSGDVFGNGLLLSNKVKLIAAFNHKHIFLDPDPDPEKSFQERKRLFEEPGSQGPHSQWSDYSPQLISKGGGVFGRFEKEIRITDEMRTSLSLPEDTPPQLNGEQLIQHILKAEVELLWNGGIGTYVKSTLESNVDVGDSANDQVRVNANKLRARVVGEGGNLGFTQLARIEFAKNGGNIFTDAIDNSGGVDLSDHEVNLKILFAELARKNTLSLKERNTLLKKIAPDVVKLVLRHNSTQGRLLSVAVRRSRFSVPYFRTLIRQLSKENYIDRDLEFLPHDDELIDRDKKREGLYQPELAVCLAGVKMWVRDELMKTALPDDPLLKSFLLDYFPIEVSEKYKEEIFEHPLAKEIVSTQATNILVDTVGITFLHRMCLNHSTLPITVIKCALAAEIVFEARQLRRAFKKIDTYANNQVFLGLSEELNGAMREATSWLVRYHGEEMSLEEMISVYREPLESLLTHGRLAFSGEEQEIYDLRLERTKSLGIGEFAPRMVAAFPRVASLLEILWTAEKTSQPVTQVAESYSQVIDFLNVSAVLAMEPLIEVNNKWERELLSGAYHELRRGVSQLSIKLLDQSITEPEEALHTLKASVSYERLASTILEIKESHPTVAAISVIAKQVRRFVL